MLHIRHLILLPFADLRSPWSCPSDKMPGGCSPTLQRGSFARSKPGAQGKSSLGRKVKVNAREHSLLCQGGLEAAHHLLQRVRPRQKSWQPHALNVRAAPDPIVQAPWAHCLTLGGAPYIG